MPQELFFYCTSNQGITVYSYYNNEFNWHGLENPLLGNDTKEFLPKRIIILQMK